MNAPHAADPAAAPRGLFTWRKHWASRFGIAPFLPMSRSEIDALGWDSCDIILVTGDAYVDHPSFGMALIGRLLEAQGFRVGIISQPDWRSVHAFRTLGRPNLFFGVTAGNMDSMVNRYTADRKPRSDDAYTPNGEADRRPDRAVVVYAQRCREAFPGSNVVIGSIEASLRRIAHYDYWSDKVRRSVLPDAKADLLLYGNAERAVVELAHRLAAGEKIGDIRDLRGSAFMVPRGWLPGSGWNEIDSTKVDAPGVLIRHADPYAVTVAGAGGVACSGSGGEAGGEAAAGGVRVVQWHRQSHARMPKLDRARTAIRLPSYEQVAADPVLYAHASRVLHLESNPGNARALVQAHGERDVWLNPPPIPLTTAEIDGVFAAPFQRRPHPAYGEAKIPAFEMIRFSVNIMRGCFGGCTFCSITEHEGRIIQSRSEQSILHEIEEIRERTPGFTGIISDLGGPTANMYRLACKDRRIESACRRLSCVFPGICENLDTDHTPLLQLYRKARALPGVKKVLISSGLRYDLAVRDPAYVRELVRHHVGGYLKIAPEHTEEGPLAHMMKPGISSYEQFRLMFERFSKEAGKEQYLIPYFIAAHPGTTDGDMLNLALWLKRNNFRLDQVQTFLPTPMALATAMYHSRRNPLHRVGQGSGSVETARGARQRRLHKAFLRYHDPGNWPLLREALRRMGRADLIGNGRQHLVPFTQPHGSGSQRIGPLQSRPVRQRSAGT
ncbi:YgiQ family radical SAM protein [Accumulibacter sp.]|uniref:YgiQ family radical SAM protein n=1 Tax=Accumulibacter sp. TaxID=2053492 RepID=UPI0025FD2460|nr:YgiQ family radical SAM protein [Accumulibacter sp.]MCM8611944.1 YgiQ family radical SAM protein [Accumulibacter sp.]MCM8635566.1 YgiQ family radical SAM protein [Accumulibacter sp.]MCM8639144.1 YgiQ family radical SAM protein [Accumulibacter sp.]